MKINITGHQLEVTEGIRAHAIEKMEKIRRHFDRPIEVALTVSVEKLQQKAAIHLHALGKDFHVSKSSSELYHAIDEAVLALDEQIKRQKDKLNEGRRHGHDKNSA